MKPKFKPNAKPASSLGAAGKPPGVSNLQALLIQALSQHQQGQLALAQTGYEQVLAAQPAHFDALHMLGVLLTQTQQPERAVVLLEQALRIQPHVAGAHENLGLALRQLNRLEDALHSYDQALALDPQHAQTHVNRGVALKSLKRYDEALQSYQTALSLQPDMVQARYNRGLLYSDVNLPLQALQAFEATLQLQPHFHPALWGKTLCLLQMGEFAQAWPLYASRWQQHEEEFTSHALRSHVPRWQQGLSPQRLLVWPEQGVGDELMFGALLAQAQTLCGELLVQLDERLIPLFARSMPNIQLIPKHVPLSESLYDAHMPMGDLPGIFCKHLEDFQALSHPYVQPDAARVRALRDLLSPDGKPLCGISWRSKNIKRGEDRSVPLGAMVQALINPQVRLVNLQYGEVDPELSQLLQTTGVEVIQCPLVDNQTDLDGLAALIRACDLVVSADNTTVHLAGAMGQAVWVLLPFSADWRWLLERSDSPWYPSARLFRPSMVTDWGPVLEQLSRAFAQRFYVAN